MNIQVLLFAQAKQLVGRDSLEVEIPDQGTVADLLNHVVQAAPELQPMQTNLLVAVNNQFANRQQVIHPSDTVACFPPVSGG
ncbi:MAG: MoaD/ThiS family protein [Fuerstiella sp.]